MNKAVFLDRDGTINAYGEGKYIHKIEDFKFSPGALSALKSLSKSEYKIIVVTNQSGIGRGDYAHEDVRVVHSWMLGEFEKSDVRIDKIYYCPHSPEDNCSCRKPNLGMVEEAVKDFNLDLSQSWMVGDNASDVMLGKNAKMKTIMVKNEFLEQDKVKADFFVDDLPRAVEIILS